MFFHGLIIVLYLALRALAHLQTVSVHISDCMELNPYCRAGALLSFCFGDVASGMGFGTENQLTHLRRHFNPQSRLLLRVFIR